jgi:predicted small metal-binding protein
MEKHLQCVVEGCYTHFTAKNEEEILEQVATHAAHDHGVTEVSPELLAGVRSAIREA